MDELRQQIKLLQLSARRNNTTTPIVDPSDHPQHQALMLLESKTIEELRGYKKSINAHLAMFANASQHIKIIEFFKTNFNTRDFAVILYLQKEVDSVFQNKLHKDNEKEYQSLVNLMVTLSHNEKAILQKLLNSDSIIPDE